MKKNTHQLIDILASATGLPETLVRSEINSLLIQHQLSSNKLNIEQLREIMVTYLQNVLVAAKDKYS